MRKSFADRPPQRLWRRLSGDLGLGRCERERNGSTASMLTAKIDSAYRQPN
jgi:hypothetical protein